ncbi:MAG TPA: MFS transporter [Rhodopila sp.]|nr:MFS transporter [Rhodopila sp.]
MHPDGLPTPQRYLSMLAIALGITMSVLDSAVANVALPTIARELHTTPAASVWVVNAYQLAIVVTLLPFASLGERIGYRRVYQAGLAVFTLGSLGCALSHSLPALVAARVVQGLGATGIMSVNGALVRFTYPQSMLGRGVGLNALVVSIAAAAGPTIASGILAIGPWEWLFAVNVPIGIANFLLAARALPHSNLSGQRFDWTSALLNALMFGLVFIGADTVGHGGGAILAAAMIACALVVGTILIRRESKRTMPLIPVDLMRIPIFALLVATSICSFAAYTLAFLVMPFYFETALHRDQVQTGLLMTPWPVAVGLVAPLAGRLSDRIPAAILGTAGLAVLAAGLTLLTTLKLDANAIDISWRMALCGLGFGFFQSPNNRTLLSSAPRSRAGAAGGMLATARLTGQTTGATLAALVFGIAPRGAENTDLLIGAGLAAVAAIASVARLPARAPAGTLHRGEPRGATAPPGTAGQASSPAGQRAHDRTKA